MSYPNSASVEMVEPKMSGSSVTEGNPLMTEGEPMTEMEDIDFSDDVDTDIQVLTADTDSQEGQATMFSCIVNLSNTILGAGMLGLPHAFGVCGWVLGYSLLIVFACLASLGLFLLSCCATKLREADPKRGKQSFYAIAMAVLPQATTLIDAAVAIKCFGVGTSYFIVVGDLVPTALEGLGIESEFLLQRRVCITICFLCGGLPLIFQKSLDALRHTSAAAIVFVLFICVVMFLFSLNIMDTCGKYGCHKDGKDTLGDDDLIATLKVLSIFIFGFTCHQNIFSITNEIQQPTIRRIGIVIFTSISMALVIYTLVATTGYETYGNLVRSDVLENYPQQSALLVVGRVCTSLLVILSYPMQFFPCRNSFRQLMFGSPGEDGEGGIFGNGLNRSAKAEQMRFLVMTAVIAACSFTLAMVLEDLGVILSIVGATGSTTISYILPGIFYYYVFADDGWTKLRIVALSLFIFGCIVIPAALTFIFM